MAACNWYGPTEPLGNVAEISATPFSDLLPIPERPVLLRQRDQLASGARSRQAASIGQQHERQQSGDLCVGRLQSVWTIRVRRIASCDRSSRRRLGPTLLV